MLFKFYISILYSTVVHGRSFISLKGLPVFCFIAFHIYSGLKNTYKMSTYAHKMNKGKHEASLVWGHYRSHEPPDLALRGEDINI